MKLSRIPCRQCQSDTLHEAGRCSVCGCEPEPSRLYAKDVGRKVAMVQLIYRKEQAAERSARYLVGRDDAWDLKTKTSRGRSQGVFGAGRERRRT